MTPTPPPDATPSQRGLMSAADAAKLAAYPDDPSSLGGGVDTLDPVGSSPNANGATIDGDTLTLQPADETHPGVVTQGPTAQTFGGPKTFAALLTATLGVVTNLVRAVTATLVLRSSLGANSSDVAVRLGTEVSDGGTHASAKLVQIGTGIGGTFVESFYFSKGGILVGQSAAVLRLNGTDGAQLDFGSTCRVRMGSTTAELRAGSGAASVFSFASTNCARSGSANASTGSTTRLHTFADGMGSTPSDKACVTTAGEFESLVNGAGVVLKSPNGTRYRITVDNAGALSVAAA